MADDNAQLLTDAAAAALDQFPGPIGNHLATSYIDAANSHAMNGGTWDRFEYLLDSARAVLDQTTTCPQPSTEDTTMTDQLRAELLRLINERGVVDLDAEDLANDVTQLFQPDNPGCWAEDETTATTRCFVKFVENNQWEGETWTHWLQVNGNEDELTKLSNLLAELELEADEDAEDPPYELADFKQQTLSEEYVDVLVEHAGGDGYAAAHTKVVGKFVCPDSLGEGGRAIYKGDIPKHFTVEAA